MPKLKTHSGTKDRVKVTKTGKVITASFYLQSFSREKKHVT